jgi:DNA-directed RNA polymerase subunit RPC12/RpoP
MSILGQCPKCGHRVLHVNVEQIVGVVDGDSKARILSYSCIHCNAVIGVQIDPRAKSRPRRKTEASAAG